MSLPFINGTIPDASDFNALSIKSEMASTIGAGLVGTIGNGAGVVSRTVKSKLNDVVSVKDFGAVGDGVTDDTDAFKSALLVSKSIYVPKGTYKIIVSTSGILLPLSNSVIFGDSKDSSIINFFTLDTSYKNIISTANSNIKFVNLSLNVFVFSGGSASLFFVISSGLTIDNCILNGNETNTGPTINNECFGLNISNTGTQNDITIKNSTIQGFSYPILKTNIATSTQSRIVISNNIFTSNYYNDLGINSPSGICNNVIVNNNVFLNNLSISASIVQQSLGIAFASVSNFIIEGNIFSNSYTDAIHIEENSINGTISNNVINSDGNGISLNGNNIGGTGILYPKNITITGNSLYKSGTLKSSPSRGIGLIFNASNHQPAKNIAIENNYCYGYENGFFSAISLDDNLKMQGNTADTCLNGYAFKDGSLYIRNNYSDNCDTGITGITSSYTTESSTIDSHGFINCTNNVISIDQPIVLLNPCFIFSKFNHSGGSTNVFKGLFKIDSNCRLDGFIEITETNETGVFNYSMVRDAVKWDGTTFTKTNSIAIQPGSVNCNGANNSGVFSIQVFAAAAINNCRVQAKLNGMAVVSV